MDARPLLELIAAADRERSGVVLVGIGGHGCAGKTTLARMIPDAQCVATDEFWSGDGFDIGRIAAGPRSAALPWRAGSIRSYDWSAGRARGARSVAPDGIVIIEGVCALHRELRDAYAVRVWVDAPAELRLARAVARDGESARDDWIRRWMPSEERYVARDDPIGCAHLVIENAGALAEVDT